MYFAQVAQCITAPSDMCHGLSSFCSWALWRLLCESSFADLLQTWASSCASLCQRSTVPSDDFSPGTAWNSTASRSDSASLFSNWQGNSSPVFLSAVTASLLPTATAQCKKNRLCRIKFRWLWMQCHWFQHVAGLPSQRPLLWGKAVFECHIQLHNFGKWFGYWWRVIYWLMKVKKTEFG